MLSYLGQLSSRGVSATPSVSGVRLRKKKPRDGDWTHRVRVFTYTDALDRLDSYMEELTSPWGIMRATSSRYVSKNPARKRHIQELRLIRFTFHYTTLETLLPGGCSMTCGLRA